MYKISEKEKDPFQRRRYRAKEFGTTVVNGRPVPFDVIFKEDAEELLGKDKIVGRVDGRIVVSGAVADIPSVDQLSSDDLFSSKGKLEPRHSRAILQIEVIREFV